MSLPPTPIIHRDRRVSAFWEETIRIVKFVKPGFKDRITMLSAYC
jgi:hypothetical protein